MRGRVDALCDGPPRSLSIDDCVNPAWATPATATGVPDVPVEGARDREHSAVSRDLVPHRSTAPGRPARAPMGSRSTACASVLPRADPASGRLAVTVRNDASTFVKGLLGGGRFRLFWRRRAGLWQDRDGPLRGRARSYEAKVSQPLTRNGSGAVRRRIVLRTARGGVSRLSGQPRRSRVGQRGR